MRPFTNPTAQQLQKEQAEANRVYARLVGLHYRVLVLAPSRSQFEKWCDENYFSANAKQSIHPPKWVQSHFQLVGIRLQPGVELIEIDGWEEAASAELLHRVRILKQTRS